MALHDLFDRCATYAARQPRAIIDEIVELEIATLAIAADEVAQRAAALFDRGGKRHAHGVCKQIVTNQRDAAGWRGRPDSGTKKAFRRVNVAHADDDLARQQCLFHGHLASARLPMPLPRTKATRANRAATQLLRCVTEVPRG